MDVYYHFHEQTSAGKFDKYGNESLLLNERANFWKILKVYTSEGYSGEAMKPNHKYLVHQLLNIILWTMQNCVETFHMNY
ncbi:hypothetical protein Hanom_Chr11g01062561 [Helianthus anomalus]